MLNFSPDHLDRHPSVEAYAAAKARIFENQTPSDWAVDQRRRSGGARDWRERGRAATRLFARRAHVAEGTRRRGRLDCRSPRSERSERLVPLDAIHLLGPHLVDDVMAAATVGRDRRRVAPAAMTAAVEAFRGLEHAMELVAEVDGVRFVNDSKATNVEVGAAIDRELRRRSGADHRRPLQGRRSARCCVRRWPRGRRPSWRSAKRGRWCARRWRARSTCTTRASLEEAVDDGVRRWRSRPASCCWRRRARASTCSATTRSVGGRSRRKSRESGARRTTRVGGDRSRPAAWPAAMVTVSGEQSSVGLCGEGLAAGNAGCPGLRSWCLHPRPTDDC